MDELGLATDPDPTLAVTRAGVVHDLRPGTSRSLCGRVIADVVRGNAGQAPLGARGRGYDNHYLLPGQRLCGGCIRAGKLASLSPEEPALASSEAEKVRHAVERRLTELLLDEELAELIIRFSVADPDERQASMRQEAVLDFLLDESRYAGRLQAGKLAAARMDREPEHWRSIQMIVSADDFYAARLVPAFERAYGGFQQAPRIDAGVLGSALAGSPEGDMYTRTIGDHVASMALPKLLAENWPEVLSLLQEDFPVDSPKLPTIISEAYVAKGLRQPDRPTTWSDMRLPLYLSEWMNAEERAVFERLSSR
jgi:hypothetical protein